MSNVETVTYTVSGLWSSYYNGYPATIKITVSFPGVHPNATDVSDEDVDGWDDLAGAARDFALDHGVGSVSSIVREVTHYGPVSP